MKKENSGKKSLLWLWITIGVVAALVVAGVLCFALGVFDSSEKEEKFTSKIYWNMDGQSFMDPATGLSDREASDDGMTYIRFAVGGEVKELPVADRTLVHKIDMKVQMCLKFDDNGVIVDMVDVDEVYTKIADKVFVQNITGDTILTNSSMALNGMPLNITLNENTGIYNMTDKTEKPGYPGALEMMDQILVYGTDENTPTDIFITHRYWYSDVYWRVSERLYDATNKCTTREKAADGYWYVDWTVNGETVTLRTNKQDVANAWDGYTPNAACCGMVFDENGDVIDCFNAALAARGSVYANNYDVTAIAEDGSSFTATRLMFGTEIGKTYTSVIDENTKIYNVNCTADVKGQPDKLQMNDRVYVITDTMGKAKIVFITNRMVDSPMYYNVSRNWSSGLKMSQRTPDADGWYHIKLAVKGKEVTYRTKDFDLVNQIDGYNLSIFGLKVENGIILKAYDAVCVTGNYSFANNNFVDSIDGVLLATSNTAGTAANGVLAADCEIYDVSGHGKFKGVATNVRVGDRVICYQNTVGEITHIYILNRFEEGSTLYWNVNRYYSGGKSTRADQKFNGEPLKDAEGYYHFRVIKVGSTDVTWVKTKDEDIVNRMDSYGTPTAFSLYVNSAGVVTGAYPCNAALGGYQAANYLHIDRAIEDESGLAKYGIRSYRTGATGTITLADNVEVYDYTADSVLKGSPVPAGGTIKGSRTTLRIGDKVSCIANREGKIQIVMIIERETSGTKLAIRKSGAATPAEDGYYYFELIIDGKVVKVKTKDEATAKKIVGYGYAFAVKLDGDNIVGVYTATASTDVYEMAGGAYYDVVKIEGGKLYLKRNRVGQSDTGKETSVALASDYKAYVIDPGSPNFGKQVKLNKGDRVYGYTDYNAELKFVYVAYECTRAGGNMGYCAHCGKTVHWESLAAGYVPAAGYIPDVAHFYVPYDRASTAGYTLGAAVQNTEKKSTEIVLDLNGKVLTRNGVVNEADGIAYASGGLLTAQYGNTLIVTDYSKEQTGALVSAKGVNYSGYTGLMHVQSNSTLIVEKGLFDASNAICVNQAANGGAISVGGTLIVNGGTIKGFKENTNAAWGGCAIGSWGNTQITINGGEIVGGKATNMGGTISANSNLTINGGKIYGGTAAVGDNIRFGNGDLVITGGEIDGGIHVSSAKSITLSGKPVVKAGTNYGLKPGKVKLDVSGLKAGASVYVDVSGVFTKDLSSAADAQALITNGALKAGTEGMMLKVDGKAVASVSDGKLREWTDATKLPDMGYWKLTVDVNTTAVSSISGELYIDLNGHNITRTVAKEALGNLADKANNIEKKSGSPQVFNVGSGNKLTIADSTGKPGTVSVKLPAADSAIHAYSAVIHVAAGGEMVLEGGIIDGSNVDNVYVDANNGTISVGGKLTVNGGVIKGFKRGSANGGAIGAWAGTEVTVNGGTIYAGGSFLTDKNVQKVNGAAIATTGSLTINGGEFIGPGKESTAEQRSRSGGLIYANGDSLAILGGTFRDGFGTGYGFNIYYERNYLGVAGADGKRPTVNGGGEVVIGGDAYINGGVTIRSGKESDPVKLTVKDTAMIDATGAVDKVNIRLVNGELYLNADKNPVTTTKTAGIEAGKNYDISLVYTCKNAPKGFSVGYTTKYEHSYGDDHLCDDCGYDKNTPVAWTDATKLPTSGNYYLDVNVETSATTTMAGELYLDLNGHTITHKALVSAIQTGANKLTITDSSTEKTGKITTSTLNGEAKGLIYIQANGELLLEAGTIDGSNVTNTYTGANAGTITIGNGKIGGESAYGSATINGGKVIGWKSSGNGSAIGMMNLTSLTINGGEIIGNQVTKSIDGTGYGGAIVANGHLTITGGKISGGTATVGGDNIFVNNASAKVTISGGEIDGGVELNAYDAANAKISGTVTIKEGANYGLKIKSGKTVDFTGLTGGEIYVDANGIFTTNFDSVTEAQLAKDLLKSGVDGKDLFVDGTAIVMGNASLPTSGTVKLTQNMTIEETLELTGNLSIDLNGYTITSTVAPAIKTAGHALTVDDTSGKTGDELGKITTTTVSGSINAGVIYANSTSAVTIKNGIIDGSNVTTTYTGANAGTITVAKTLVVDGGKIIGWNSCGNGGAIGSWGGTSITINGGEIVGGTLTQSGTNTATGHGGAIAPNGNLTINGGKIHGGTAVNGGDNIWINNAASVVTITGGEIDGGIVLNNFSADSKISGTVTIKEGANYGLKFASGKTIDMTGLTGGEIYINADGVFTTNFTNATAANTALAFLKSGDTTKALSVDGTAIKMATATTPGPEPEPETPIEEQAWVEWNATADASFETKLPTAGKYKLTSNVAIGEEHVLLTGDLWIDLNGYTITRNVTTGQTSKQYVFNVNNAEHTLLIDDLSGKTGDELGKITASYASGLTCSTSGGLIQVDAGELILNNGIIDGTPITADITTANNAAVMINAKFTMNGGMILGQYSKKYTSSGQSGSCVGAWSTSDITINGGTLKAYQVTGTSYACSSGACIATSGKLTINGGELIGTRAGARGGAIYATKGGENSSVTINGGTIKNCFGLSGGAIFADTTPVTINGGVIVGNKAANAAQGHTIDAYKNTLTIGGNTVISGGITVRGGGKLVLKDAPIISDTLGVAYADITLNSGSVYLNDTTGTAIATANGNYSLTYTNGKVSGLAAYAAMADWTETTSLPTSGKIKLTAGVTLSEAVTTTGNLTIDLNGQTITGESANGLIIANGNTLVILDSSAEKTGKIINTKTAVTSEASVIYAKNKSNVVIAGGTIDASAVVNSYDGVCGAVSVGSNCNVIVLDGTINGHKASNTNSGKGGSVFGMQTYSNLVIYGGKFYAKEDGTNAVSAAGTVITAGNNSVATIYGGELYGSRATNHGGNIYTTGNLYVRGGLISGGYAYNSGLICSNGANAALEITGGTLVGGSCANAGAGGASVDKLNSTAIIGGNAKIAGGICIRSNAKLVLKDSAQIDMEMTGQTYKKFNIKVNSGSIFLKDATGTAIATANGNYNVNYGVNGQITGVAAE